MTEIPEHLRKRAEEAKAKAAAKAAEGAAPAEAAPAAAASASDADSKIPAHLLERAKAARAKAAGGEAEAAVGGGTAVATAASPAAPAQSGPPLAAGPGGHTQRLLTVVKSGSIQDVKASPQDKVHVWPHLLSIEFVAALMCLGFTLVFSIFVNAPLLELADINKTPNPSKAPWYFLGLQEMLTMFHPMVAGVLLPGMGMAGLMFAPYIDRNPSQKPENRKFAISLFTIFMMACATLTIIGSFFRGPGQLFIFPWAEGLFFEL
ncbi:MAG: menaquinol-cytochrome c reductase cytochrome b subunit [Acidimicrobiales bacterium]|jgi:menaquinol-cytochrome c reductase cytochrome b/c subunit|nr:menaquinol-cytochrome c reductase cytochrome b subunit [Acidimicrobiales bacterium]